MRFLIPVLSSLASLFVQVEAVSAQDPLPFTVAEGPPRSPWSNPVATSTVTLRFDRGMPAPIEVVRLGRAVDDRSWHMAQIVHATVSEGELALKFGVSRTTVAGRFIHIFGGLLDAPRVSVCGRC